MQHVMFALFPDARSAEQAVADVRDLGFGTDRLTVVTHRGAINPDTLGIDESDAREGAAGGALIGAAAGAATMGAVALLGPLGLVGAEIAVAIAAGAAAGGAYGALGATLVGSSVPDRTLAHWRKELKRGRVILTVTTDAMEDHEAVEGIFERHGATEVRKHVVRPQSGDDRPSA